MARWLRLSNSGVKCPFDCFFSTTPGVSYSYYKAIMIEGSLSIGKDLPRGRTTNESEEEDEQSGAD